MSDDVSRSWSASVGLPTGVGPDDSFCIPDGDDALANFFPGLDRIPLCAVSGPSRVYMVVNMRADFGCLEGLYGRRFPAAAVSIKRFSMPLLPLD